MDKDQKIIVAVSGGFDPVHTGHVLMFEEAKKLGDHLVVILNNDNWLRKKKGFVFMPEDERKHIILSLGPVDEVLLTGHDEQDGDTSVSRELESLKPHIFANGGDRKDEKDIPETTVCKKYNIKTVFNVGGGKVQSSSNLSDNAARRKYIIKKPWGQFEDFAHTNTWHIKTIDICAGHRFSLQRHKHRSEIWTVIEGEMEVELRENPDSEPSFQTLKVGDTVTIPIGMVHRAFSEIGVKFTEVGIGNFDENDIERFEDDYGRV